MGNPIWIGFGKIHITEQSSNINLKEIQNVMKKIKSLLISLPRIRHSEHGRMTFYVSFQLIYMQFQKIELCDYFIVCTHISV
jgi:hypothetical protein